ncbi:hypothetical protein FPV67DRAFT_58739 [Lyophyllum atratum]|nr:hypothetical protein FPV67DRAFT_58739 [Lyophyllum atratum]
MLDEIHSDTLSHLLTSVLSETPVGLTHIPALDAHLFSTAKNPMSGSSLRRGDVVEIQGAPSSGKTHLLYHLLIHCITPSNLGGWGKVGIVFDMDHSFDVVRFNHLLLGHLTRLLAGGASVIGSIALERLRIFRPSSSLQLSVTISHLAEYHSVHFPNEEIGLVAIDSMSAHYWPDRFVVEQMRTATSAEHRREAETHVPPLQHVLLALESFRRTHSPVTILTNWGLHSASNIDPFLYRQHLHPFPAPFPHSHPATIRRDTNAPILAFQEHMPRLTCHITLHQDSNGKVSSSETDDSSVAVARKGVIVGLIRTPHSASISRFLLHITADDILAN